MSEAASNSISSTPSAPARAWSIISWGAFLACSWTWCIGMWLPVILLRDFGIWSFAAFAIPNVFGAAAMGVVLQRRGLSEWITTEHAFAARFFSKVTIAFQFFFLLWLSGMGSVTNATWPMVAVLCLCVAAAFIFRGLFNWLRQASVVVWIVSLLVLLWFFASERPSVSRLPQPVLNSNELLWLTPVLVLGFLLCPYLDLTFHRARQTLHGAAGSVAFVLGFSVLFLAMIVGTLGYGVVLLSTHTEPLPMHLPTLIAVHIAIQLAFTMTVHGLGSRAGNEVQSQNLDAKSSAPGGSWLWQSVPAPLILLVVALILLKVTASFEYAGLSAAEIIYRGFMSFYGLIFPAYVWLCMLPLGTTRTPRRVWTFAAAVVLASPFYWMGFIERETIWLVPGVAIVLFAKLIAGGAPRRSA